MGYKAHAYDAELFQRLAAAYKLDATYCLSRLDEAFAKGDLDSIAKTSYALSRAASILSAEGVCTLLHELELAAREGMIDVIPDMIHRLRDEHTRLIERLE